MLRNKIVRFKFLLLLLLSVIACNESVENSNKVAKPKNMLFITHTSTIGGKGVYPIYREAKKLGHNVKIAVIPQIFQEEIIANVDLKFASLFDTEDVIFPCGKSEPHDKCDKLEQYKLDYIFTQNPYDFFNGTILENFTVSNLQKIAKVNYIVYGPHIFHQNAIEAPDLPNFVDNVFVDSDSTKDIYVNNYNFPKERVIVSGYQSYKSIRNLKQNNKETQKETILYMPRWLMTFKGRDKHEGGGTFLNYHYFFYNFAKKNPQIDFIFIPHVLWYKHAIEGEYIGKKDLDKIIEKFRALPNLTISSHVNVPLIEDILKSDIVISEGSSALAEVVIADKPIIYLSNGANIEFESNALSKEFKKHVFLAYDPGDIKNYIEFIRQNNYIPNTFEDGKMLGRQEFKRMLDPVENPGKFIAEYLLYN